MNHTIITPAANIIPDLQLLSKQVVPMQKDKKLSETFAFSGQRAGLLIAASLAACLKLYCAWTTLGSNDVVHFSLFASRLNVVGLIALYHQSLLFNHTPMVAAYIAAIYSLAGGSLDAFAFLLRLPGICSEFLLALWLIEQQRHWKMPTWALGLFVLSPVSFMVTGFHGNFDALMIFFLFAAAAMASQNKALACGVFFALSLQIKVPAMIVLPVFLIFWVRQKQFFRFALSVALVCLIGYAEPLWKDPAVFLRNVFGYSSYWGGWGISYWLAMTGSDVMAVKGFRIYTLWQGLMIHGLKVGIMLAITLLAWRRRASGPAGIFATLALAWSIFFFFSPGICPQYMVWLAPFVLLCDARWSFYLTVGSSLYCFFFYNAICNGMPWFYGNSQSIHFMLWGPWMLWAWVACGYGLCLVRKESRPSLSPVPIAAV